MLDHADRHALGRWCRTRRVKWFAATTGAGGDAVLLAADTGGWPAMRLVRVTDGWLLETGAGEALAAASALPALLDAMDAGIAEIAPLPMGLGGTPGAGFHGSETVVNAAGSAIT